MVFCSKSNITWSYPNTYVYDDNTKEKRKKKNTKQTNQYMCWQRVIIYEILLWHIALKTKKIGGRSNYVIIKELAKLLYLIGSNELGWNDNKK